MLSTDHRNESREANGINMAELVKVVGGGRSLGMMWRLEQIGVIRGCSQMMVTV